MKALILDESRKKFATVLEGSGWWELPGGGLDWGESPDKCLRREIKEEMGLEVKEVASTPSYYLLGKNMKGHWTLNLIFEVTVKNLDFAQSDECKELKFISSKEAQGEKMFRTVKELGTLFDPQKHV